MPDVPVVAKSAVFLTGTVPAAMRAGCVPAGPVMVIRLPRRQEKVAFMRIGVAQARLLAFPADLADHVTGPHRSQQRQENQ
jgi:hypothetical protein